MDALSSDLLNWIKLNPHWGGFAIGLVAFIESVALLGIIIPGVVLLFALATLIGAGVLPLWPCLFWAMAGAILGDQLSYWLGWRFKEQLWDCWPLSKYPNLPKQTKQLIDRFGIYAIVIGRFIGPLRPFVPAMAGMGHMPALRFTLANLGSAILWAPAYLLPGALLGASIQESGSFTLVIAGIAALACLLIFLLRRVFRTN